MKKLKRKSIVIFTLVSLAGWLASSPVSADLLQSDSFVIQFGNFNVTSGEKSSATYNVTDTVGQVANGPYGQYGSSGYFVGGGFQYIYQIGTFSFTLSRTAVDLGEVGVGAFNSGSLNLTISTKGAGGYTVYAYELHPLRHSNGVEFIPDTTCDAGSCTETSAEVWVNPGAPGFGYNMTGNDVPADFVDATYFRPFANQAASEPMAIVMSSANVAENRQSTATYQVAVAGSQGAGNYQTGIVYVAVPGY